MKLYISNCETDKPFQDDYNNMRIPCHYLKLPGTHLFLASQEWDEVYVELSEDIPVHTLNYLNIHDNNVHLIKVPDEITGHMVTLLSDLFPDLSGKIRTVYMTGGDMKESLKQWNVVL